MNGPVKRKNCRGRERKEKGKKARTTERRNDEKKVKIRREKWNSYRNNVGRKKCLERLM